MASLFDKLEAEAFRSGITKRSKKAADWFRNKLKAMGQVNMHRALKDKRLKKVQRPRVGDMYMYIYDPKHRKTLPYYDRFPLTIMVDVAPGGFYGLNLHYLPLQQRAILLDKLTEITNNQKYDETTRMKLNYNLLKSASKFKYFAPCFKHYLTEQIDSRIMKVEAPEWEIAIFLPTENFAKKKKTFVWKESRSKW